MQDMDGATNSYGPIQDMVVEGADGAISIHKGDGNGGFATPSIGGTGAGNSLTGDGGRLVAVDPNTLNILTATPIGLSVLQNTGSLSYTLKNIYNIGPGRESFALADFSGTGGKVLDLAVNSPEGVAIAQGDDSGDGGFQTSLAYSTLAPALGATVNYFQGTTSRSGGHHYECFDVVAAIDSASSAVQGQLLSGNSTNGNCDDTYTIAPAPTNTTGNPSGVPHNVWPNIFSGSLNLLYPGIAYSLTGIPPLPTSGTGLYIQFGNADGTFQPPVAVTGESSGNTLYGNSTVGYFETSDTSADIVNADEGGNEILLGPGSGNGAFNPGLDEPAGSGSFNQVAVGFFNLTPGREGNQDIVFQQGTSIVPYKNNDNDTFSPETPLSGTPAASSNLVVSKLLLWDMDGDGYEDIIAIYHNTASTPANPSPSTPNWLYIWWGNGDGTFSQTPYKLQLSRNYYLATVGDMNNDRLPDIVLSDGYLVGILYNLGALGTPANRSFGTITNGVANVGVEQQFLAGQGINSLTLVNPNDAVTPSLIVANGGAAISDPLVLAAEGKTGLPTNPPDINTGGITVLANAVTTLPLKAAMLTSSPDPSEYGQEFTLTATLQSAPGVAEPTGTVAFSIDGSPAIGNTASGPSGCAYAPITQGTGTNPSTASCVIPQGNTYTVGTHTLTASYSGDPANSSATLQAATPQTIENGPTTTTLELCIGGSSPNCPVTGTPGTIPLVPSFSITYGQVFNGTYAATANDGSALDPASTLTLYDSYNGGSALPVCTGNITTLSNCQPTIGSSEDVGTGEPVGTHIFYATYNGDATHTTSTSTPPITITVTPDTVNATVIGIPSPAKAGQPVTLTATLAGPNAPLGTTASPVGLYQPPSGTVNFFLNGSTPIPCDSAPTLVAGASGVSSTATCVTSTLPVGSDPITVSYAGSLDFLPLLASAAFSQTIAPLAAPSFSIAVTPNPASINVGYGALLTVSVTAANGFNEDVKLSCANLPSEMTCVFSPPTVAGGSGTSNLIVETAVPHDCGATQPYFFGSNGGGPGRLPLTLPALAGLIALFIPGKRRRLRALTILLVAGALTQITGCSRCTDLGTKPATYTIQVIGTSTVTGAVGSQAVAIKVVI